MLKFAQMHRYWDFRKNEGTAVQWYWYEHDHKKHVMAFDAESELVLHQISGITAAVAAEKATNEGVALTFDAAYALVPDVFQDADYPGLSGPVQKIPVEGGYNIVFPEGTDFPAAMPLYRLAFEAAKTTPHFVLVHVHNQQVTVAAFSEQKPLLLNTFPAGNEAEALYFALAPFKRAGISTTDIAISVLSDSTALPGLLQQFGRFVPQVKPFHFSLPYPVDQYPPHADISLLLFTLSQCGLPAVH